MRGARLDRLGKAECSEYLLYRTGFCFRAAGRRKATPGRGQETWFPDLALLLSPQVTLDQSQASLGLSFSLCEMRVLVYIRRLPALVLGAGVEVGLEW